MSLYTFNSGSVGLTDVNYVWLDSAGADIGSPTNTDVSESPASSGIYIIDKTPPSGAQGIYWDSATDTEAYGIGDVRPENFEVLGIETDGDLTQVNALAGHTAQTADHTTGIADIPTVAEFNARTLAAADYFDPAADTVATVTTLTGHTAQTGDTYALANGAAGFVAIDTVADGIQTDLDNATDGLGALKTLIDAVKTVVDGIPTTAMRGTDSAALATALVTAQAAIDAIPTTPMRGTDSAALATTIGTPVGADISADIAGISGGGGLTASQTRDALGMASANLDTQIAALPTAAEIDTELTGTHGAGSWAVGGSGSGAFGITITVTDGTDPLENASVRILEGATPYTGTTDASGNASFSLDAATFSVRVTKGGYSFTPTTRTVTAEETGTLTDDLEMTAVTVSSPADPELCRCSGTFVDIAGNAIVGASITLQLMGDTNTDPAKATKIIKIAEFTATTDSTGALTDVDGNAYLDLIRNDSVTPTGSFYRITSADFGLSRHSFTLDAATFDLLTLIS